MWAYIIIIILVLILLYLNQKTEYQSDPPTRIKRWRDSVPKEIMPGEPRQEQDDWWEKNYNSGIGFVLG